MRTIVKGKNVEVPDRVRDYAERKLGRLERLLDDRTDAIVELSNEQHRSAADSHIVEVTLVIDGRTLRSHAVGDRATRRRSTRSSTRSSARRSTTRRSRASAPGRRRRSASCAASPTAPRERGRERRIVKTKRFAIEPMFEEDAVAAMEELGHQFFVFVNAETERVAILYAREDGDFGLIEPIVGGEYTTGRQRDNGRDGRPDRRAGRRRTAPLSAQARPPVAPAVAGDQAARRPSRAGASPRPGGTGRGAG